MTTGASTTIEHRPGRTGPGPGEPVERVRALARSLSRDLSAVDVEPLRRADGELTAIAADLGRRVAEDALEGVSIGEAIARLREIGRLQERLRRQDFERPFDTLLRVRTTLDDLRGAETAVELVEAVSAAMCSSCGFDRAMISYVRGSTWVPHRLHVANEPEHPANVALRDFARTARIPLAATMYETELVRRRAPALVHDARDESRTFRPVVDLSGSRSYVVVPVTAEGSVIGFFHADTFSSGRDLDDDDRDAAHAFADGFGLLFEGTVRAERLARGRTVARTTFAGAVETSRDLREEPVQFPDAPAEGAPVPSGQPPAAKAAGDPIARLTSRENEVLALMAKGASNNQIAAELVIAQSTVKSHVKHIMRKLDASNRTAAVSQYLMTARAPGGRA